ncbi:hypothetical protein F6X37_28870 [Paraburkholderia sp. 31.1]|uniref:hypothetical protein n=1 Tax=Paraburkholderia sp. 31.1 TaxID=2615205 RepID=UPI00165661A9|nr:hypothetical protein [Paraburkholderia sp. 31.1]MBC8725438.1 hypothetical protein [Paraburkholderia sp. 31.1]
MNLARCAAANDTTVALVDEPRSAATYAGESALKDVARFAIADSLLYGAGRKESRVSMAIGADRRNKLASLPNTTGDA